jgi:hypothetical protein
MQKDGTLEPGDVVDVFSSGNCVVDYVNSSGAFVVPLTPVIRTVRGHDRKTGAPTVVQFKQQKDGFTISARAGVKLVGKVEGYTSRDDRRHATMGTREGALKAAATRAKNRAAAKGGAEPVDTAAAATQEQTDSAATSQVEAPSTGDTDATAAEVMAASEPDLINVAPEPGSDLGVDAPEGEDNVAKKTKTNRKTGQARARQPKAEKVLKACACGCGEQTGGYFVQGHDARFKGWMLKIERGEAKKSELLKPSVIRAYDWVGTRGGGERATTNYKGEKHSGYDKAAK